MFRVTRITRVHRAPAIGISAAGIALALGAAAWAATAASAATAAPAAVPACATSHLSVWVDPDQSNGAAGTIAYPLEFTNRGPGACTLKGYPGVSALGLTGKQLGSPANREPSFAAATVTIPAGGTAHADLFWHDDKFFSPSCKPATASLIKVYPPNSKQSAKGFFGLDICTVKKDGSLSVSVVRPGANLGL